jgi:hypothetical protein
MTSGVSLTASVSGATVALQPPISNSNSTPASTSFVNQQIILDTAAVTFANVTGGIYNQATLGSGCTFVIVVSGGAITSIPSIVTGGSSYAVGDILGVQSGNYDGIVRVTAVSSGAVTALAVAYPGTGYTTGLTAAGLAVPPGQRFAIFNGTLTSNLTFIITAGTYLTASRRPCFANNCTGSFTITVYLSNGAGGTTGNGVVLTQGTNNSTAQLVVTDGVNDVWKVA